MDTPPEEQDQFQHITCATGIEDDDVSAPGVLSLDNLQQVEEEVEAGERWSDMLIRQGEEMEY